MKTLNLNDLLADLEKTAGMEKVATATKPNVTAELSGILEKKAAEDVTASALAAGEALAKEFLTKLASELTEDPKAKMTGDKKENEIQAGNDQIVAFDNSKIVANEGAPGTGTKPEPGLEGALEGTVEEGLKRGAKDDDLVDEKLDNGGHKKTAEETKSENAEMAKNIMNKIAQIVGVTPTTPAAGENLTPGTAPNLIQHGNEQMTAFDDKKVEALPGAEGSLNNILEKIVDNAKAQGAVSEDLVNGDLPATDADSDKEVIETDEYEKTAAVTALVEAGCSFDDAIALVKQAEEMLNIEADQQEKVAAITELCASGYDFDTAVELVKQAEAELNGESKEMDKVAAVNSKIAEGSSFEEAVEWVKEASKKEKGVFKPFPKKDMKERAHEKKAAFDALIEAGIDFDQATALVKQAEIDVYGEE